jgi:hypothetical protein
MFAYFTAFFTSVISDVLRTALISYLILVTGVDSGSILMIFWFHVILQSAQICIQNCWRSLHTQARCYFRCISHSSSHNWSVCILFSSVVNFSLKNKIRIFIYFKLPIEDEEKVNFAYTITVPNFMELMIVKTYECFIKE